MGGRPPRRNRPASMRILIIRGNAEDGASSHAKSKISSIGIRSGRRLVTLNCPETARETAPRKLNCRSDSGTPDSDRFIPCDPQAGMIHMFELKAASPAIPGPCMRRAPAHA